MTTTPLSPERLAEIEKLRDDIHERNASVKFGDPRYVCNVNSKELLGLVVGTKELLSEVGRLQSAVFRLANAERDLAEAQLVLEQQDRDMERLRAEAEQLQRALAHAASENWAFNVKVSTEISENRMRIVALESSLAAARTYSPFSALPCPLCTYEDGTHTVSCAMHARIDEQSATIASLRGRLSGAESDGRAAQENWRLCEDENDRLEASIAALDAGLREIAADCDRDDCSYGDRLRALADGVQSQVDAAKVVLLSKVERKR
jgi:chromosome segregation ATPase